MRTFAVVYAPNDGPTDVIIVSAPDFDAARAAAVQVCHEIDMDAVDPKDFTPMNLGEIDSIMIAESAVDGLVGVHVADPKK